jgi:hypothetical protein
MKKTWMRRKGAEFEREVLRRLAVVFGKAFVRRRVRSRDGRASCDVAAPRLWIECTARRRANVREALRRAERGARLEGRWAVAVCKDDRKPPRATMNLDDFVALLSDWHDLLLQRR